MNDIQATKVVLSQMLAHSHSLGSVWYSESNLLLQEVK